MATAANTSLYDASDISDDSESQDEDDNFTEVMPQPCRYYNSGGCRDGSKCLYLHICKYALKGNCRNGSNCSLSHSITGEARTRAEGQTPGPTLTNGRIYQWQLYDGNSWMDIENDHVIEAQYSLPENKGMKLYNLPIGSVCIDFERMRVIKKSLKVRRLDDGNTEWAWYVILSSKWTKYGEQGSTQNPCRVNSQDIEQAFLQNPKRSFTFDLRGETLEIDFKTMQQISKKAERKRRVARRPLLHLNPRNPLRPQVTSVLQSLHLGTRAVWEFECNTGRWCKFKHRRGTSTECSVDSQDIELAYQQNPTGRMSFQVSGQNYMLDFAAMKQINATRGTNNIRRVLV